MVTMKIYISKINESWIIDRMKDEFIKNNQDIVTNNIKDADIIWIIAPWLWRKIPKKQLKNKIVLCSIHHLEEKDFSGKNLKEFYRRDSYVNIYHTISEKSKKQIREITNKKIISIPFWINENIFYEIKEKENLRNKFGLSNKDFVIGSFQRDTEGSDLKSPKLIKGPDRFLEIVKYYNSIKENFVVLLAGYRRQYLINHLEKENIRYKYIEMVDFKILNELYNCLDLYIVTSRVEGGPQAILECGITNTPIISTDVGVASEILSKDSIFVMNNFKNAKPNPEFAYKNAKKFTSMKGNNQFITMFNEILND
tara:strand:- start:163 stop:1095 length:933 start_codon:yes stop_codon:yes gene_type:complete